jgi:competence protein ComEC
MSHETPENRKANRTDNPGARSRIQKPLVQAVAGAFPWPVAGLPRPALGLGDIGPWLTACIAREAERRHLFPWIPVCFGIGILVFLAADGRPALWAPLLAAGLGFTAAVALRGRAVGMPIAIALTALFAGFAGFAAGVVRTRSVEAPVLQRTMIVPLSGFIETIEERGAKAGAGTPAGARLTLRVHALGTLPPEERPARVRVTVRDPRGLSPGLFVSANARLLPPPESAWPGGYDFARDAYFRGIGAVGSLVGSVARPPAPSRPPFDLAVAAAIDEARNTLARRIATASGGAAGGVAAALVTGKRGFIDEPTNDVLRAAGIYHIVSISGLHMVLAAGTFFGVTRALLALWPTAALLWPIKKIAALVAMVGAAAYCIFSGSEVATERSLIMTLVMFGAVLVDRPALSLRNLSLAALIVLAREPETLLGPSFQMSFGAVAALVALAAWLQPRLAAEPGGGALVRCFLWARRSFFGLIAVTLVASLATAPFAAYHFQTLTPLGLLGNALALPLVSLVVMPAALIGTFAYPFGLDRPVWIAMGAAVDGVLRLSAWVSGFEASTLLVPAFGAGALALMSLALLLVTIPVSALRWLAVLPAGAGLALAASPERYDLFVDRDGGGAAVRGANGRLVLVGRPSGFVAEQWLRADGDARAAADPSLREGVRCDRWGCVVAMRDGRALAFVQDSRAFEEDCRRAAVIVSRLAAPEACGAAVEIDRAVLRANGATALRLTPAEPAIRTSRPAGDPRPWMRPLPGTGRQAPLEAASTPPAGPAEPDEPPPADEDWR